jgi:hypothetical protein
MTSVQDMFNTYQQMEKDNVILSFKGIISRELLDSIYQLMESKMISLNEDLPKRKRVYNILVESLQNIYHHLDELWQEDEGSELKSKDAMFMVVRTDDGLYTVYTGNYLLSSKCGLLQEKIDHINSLTAEQLRSHYVDTLNTTELSEKGGAGLGMIDLARKSGNKLAFSFAKVSEKYSFFSLAININ